MAQLDSNQDTIRDQMRERFSDPKFVATALAGAVDAAIRSHKDALVPLAEWRDGNVHMVAPGDVVTAG